MTGFENTLKIYLDEFASKDNVFAVKYRSGKKTVEGCAKYITEEVRKKASNGCYVAKDEEVYGLAVHYFDEDSIEEFSGKAPSARVTQSTATTKVNKGKVASGKQKSESKPSSTGAATGMADVFNIKKPSAEKREVKKTTPMSDPFANVTKGKKIMTTDIDLFANINKK